MRDGSFRLNLANIATQSIFIIEMEVTAKNTVTVVKAPSAHIRVKVKVRFLRSPRLMSCLLSQCRVFWGRK